MESENKSNVESSSVVRYYCPNEGSRMIHKESLTNDPELSGWECPVCMFCFYDE